MREVGDKLRLVLLGHRRIKINSATKPDLKPDEKMDRTEVEAEAAQRITQVIYINDQCNIYE